MENSLISKAFVAIQAELPQIVFDDTVSVTMKSGGRYSFKYASLPNIMQTIKPILTKYKTAICQLIGTGTITTRLIHESGECLESVSTLPFQSNMTNQEMGSVISYFRRYTIISMLGIVADEDEDGNIADGNHYAKPATTTPAATAKPPEAVDKSIAGIPAPKREEPHYEPIPEIAQQQKPFPEQELLKEVGTFENVEIKTGEKNGSGKKG